MCILQVKDAIRISKYKHPDGIAVFVFDCSSAHEAFAVDALIAHKMNRNPAGAQPKMHDTTNPLNGEIQSMSFPEDYKGTDKDGVSLAGKPKGMEQVLRERGLLEGLKNKHGKKLHKICTECSKLQAARKKAAKEAKTREDEIEGSGVEGLGARVVSEEEENDLTRSRNCCMQRVLSLQPDLCTEKPLLQLVIEKAGHKCLFLPKFHCELNPIEMIWGQAKHREFFILSAVSCLLMCLIFQDFGSMQMELSRTQRSWFQSALTMSLVTTFDVTFALLPLYGCIHVRAI